MANAASPPSRAETLADAASLLGVWAALAWQFPPSLLLSASNATGGDTPAHYYTLVYLREHLLPLGRVTGWCPANYAGFPLLEFYFPLPFLAMAAFSAVVALPVAFKLGTVLGLFMLPACAYGAMRLLRAPFPAPAFAAIGTLPFLFMEANSYWGGNIPSTLAGEFAYSLGIALSVLWLGCVRRGLETGRLLFANALLVALIGLSHGYALVFVGAATLALLAERKDFGRRLVYLTQMHALGVLLMAFWLVPLVARLPNTTAFDIMLDWSDVKKLLPPILWPQAALAAFAWARRAPGSGPALSAAAAALALWLVGPALGVVDFRFLPFAQIGLALGAAAGLAALVRRLRGKALLPLAALALAVYGALSTTRSIPVWIGWNYSGFEAKAGWRGFAAVTAELKGGDGDPRVVYEHSAKHDAIGTVRAFECLPVFSGRSTLEHAYLQAVPTSLFVFYIQSLVSREISCPFPSYACAWLSPERARKRLRLFNVREVLTVSSEAKAAFAAAPGYSRVLSTGPYEVFALEGPHAYVEALAYEPVLWTGAGSWKDASYRWFRDDGLIDVPLVFPRGAAPEALARFSLRAGDFNNIPRRALARSRGVVRERLSGETVEFETEAVGLPHLVKVSWHPNWTVEGADAVYLVSPSFMLVYPTQRNVRLRWRPGGVERAGLGLTALGLLAACALLVFRRKTPRLPRLESALERLRTPYAAALGLALAACVFPATRQRAGASDSLLAKAAQFEGQKRWDAAARIYRAVALERPGSRFAEQARMRLGIDAFLQERWAEAAAEFTALLDTFPDSRHAPEAGYHVVVCLERLGQRAQAGAAARALRRAHPSSPWAARAEAAVRSH